MIEVVYKEEKQEANGNEGVFSVPRNIRQIGLISGDFRIYVEDYVYTFLGRLADAGKSTERTGGCLAVLTGEIKWSDGITYVFVRGALAAENVEAAADHIDLDGSVWKHIQEEIGKYFEGQEIVGWFFAQPELPVEVTEVFERAHRKFFGGEKVLMLMDSTEREDAFFRCENNFLTRQRGYYLYYEKNPLMQAYMIEKGPGFSPAAEEKVSDDAVKVFRKIIREKKKDVPEKTEEGSSVFSYVATVCLAAAVLAVGFSFYNNYRELQTVEQQTAAVSSVITGELQETPVPTAAATAAPTPKAEETAASDEGEAAGEDGKTAEELEHEASVYQQESDARKAKRKLAQEQQAAQESGDSGESEEQETANTHTSYIVKPGDTLYQISMDRYGSIDGVQKICELNGINMEEIIYPGQIIELP